MAFEPESQIRSLYNGYDRELTPGLSSGLVTFNIPNSAPTGFLRKFIDVLNADSKSVRYHAIKKMDRTLLDLRRKNEFVPIGYIDSFNMIFTHVRNSVKPSDLNFDSKEKFGVSLCPIREMGYAFCVFQPGRVPVALVSYADPDGHMLKVHGSNKSPVYNNPPNITLTVEDMYDIDSSSRVVRGHTAYMKKYKRLENPVSVIRF